MFNILWRLLFAIGYITATWGKKRKKKGCFNLTCGLFPEKSDNVIEENEINNARDSYASNESFIRRLYAECAKNAEEQAKKLRRVSSTEESSSTQREFEQSAEQNNFSTNKTENLNSESSSDRCPEVQITKHHFSIKNTDQTQSENKNGVKDEQSSTSEDSKTFLVSGSHSKTEVKQKMKELTPPPIIPSSEGTPASLQNKQITVQAEIHPRPKPCTIQEVDSTDQMYLRQKQQQTNKMTNEKRNSQNHETSMSWLENKNDHQKPPTSPGLPKIEIMYIPKESTKNFKPRFQCPVPKIKTDAMTLVQAPAKPVINPKPVYKPLHDEIDCQKPSDYDKNCQSDQDWLQQSNEMKELDDLLELLEQDVVHLENKREPAEIQPQPKPEQKSATFTQPKMGHDASTKSNLLIVKRTPSLKSTTADNVSRSEGSTQPVINRSRVFGFSGIQRANSGRRQSAKERLALSGAPGKTENVSCQRPQKPVRMKLQTQNQSQKESVFELKPQNQSLTSQMPPPQVKQPQNQSSTFQMPPPQVKNPQNQPSTFQMPSPQVKQPQNQSQNKSVFELKPQNQPSTFQIPLPLKQSQCRPFQPPPLPAKKNIYPKASFLQNQVQDSQNQNKQLESTPYTEESSSMKVVVQPPAQSSYSVAFLKSTGKSRQPIVVPGTQSIRQAFHATGSGAGLHFVTPKGYQSGPYRSLSAKPASNKPQNSLLWDQSSTDGPSDEGNNKYHVRNGEQRSNFSFKKQGPPTKPKPYFVPSMLKTSSSMIVRSTTPGYVSAGAPRVVKGFVEQLESQSDNRSNDQTQKRDGWIHS